MSVQAHEGVDPVAAFLLSLSQVSRDLVGRTLGQARSSGALESLYQGSLSIADVAIERMSVLLPSERPIECGKGCDHCCRQTIVMTDPVTVLYLARQVKALQDAADREACLQSLEQGSHRPCALLAGEICAVYRQRPVICRAYNAYDSDACAAGLLPDLRTGVAERAYPVPFGVAASVATGIVEGLNAIGLVGEQLPINAALRLAVSSPEIESRWLAGQDVFEPVRTLVMAAMKVAGARSGPASTDTGATP